MKLSDQVVLQDLCDLIDQCGGYVNYYYILVDHDGTARIEPAEGQTPSQLGSYKFYFHTLLQGHAMTGPESTRNQKYMNQLFKDLIYCWNHSLKGFIDQDTILRSQNLLRWIKYQVVENKEADLLEEQY